MASNRSLLRVLISLASPPTAGATILKPMLEPLRKDGKFEWFAYPRNPRQREEEEPEYYMGLLLALVHACRIANPTVDLTWVVLHYYLLERCRHPIAGPYVLKLVEYMRHADIGFMVRDSERQHDPRDGWDLYRCAQRLALTTLFTTNNAFKYVRLTLDEQYMYETNSELWTHVGSTRRARRILESAFQRPISQ